MKLDKSKSALFSLITIGIMYGVIEVFVAVFYITTLGKFYSPNELLTRAFPRDWQSNTNIKCEYNRMLGPHPYMGFVMYGDVRRQCQDSYPSTVNNVLMSGQDYPEKKDSDSFVVMLTGGSVADQLGSALKGDGRNYFENYLNERFHAPNGKPFKIIVSALGDYRFPQNIIGPILHHQKIHGIIDLSGYNETHQYNSFDYRLDMPSPSYWNLFDLEKEFHEGQGLLNNKQVLKIARETWCRNSFSCVFIVEKYFQAKLAKIMNEERRYSHQKRLFLYPKEWSAEEKWQDRMNTHKGYYKINYQVCKVFDLYCAYFLQPIPQISKTLTDVERNQIINENIHWKDHYGRLTSELLEMSKDGIPIYSLLDVFKDQKQTIYSDHIHYFRKPDEEVSMGNHLVIEKISETIARRWELKKK